MPNKRAQLLGKTFGRLTPVEDVGVDPISRLRLWRCTCSCGGEKIVPTASLTHGGTTSCGCIYKGRGSRPKKQKPGTAFRELLNIYKVSACRRGFGFTLTVDDFRFLTSSNCFYCGRCPAQRLETQAEHYLYNGLDRKDNSLGYTIENVVPCCWPCNELKGSYSFEEFLAHVRRIVGYLA